MHKLTLLLYLLIFLGSGLYVSGQEGNTVTGKVTDTDGEVLPGVNIVEKGTSNGSITDNDGNYSISVAGSDATLVFSYIGFLTEEMTVGSQTVFDLALIEDIAQLDEIIVIGYGSVKKRDLTGAVSSVRSEEISQAPVTNTIEAIQGRVAGLDISRSDGRASSGMKILLRGDKSIKGDAEPLYVIDGIQGNIENLNPNDILSIDVLKDASSTAIYGSKGANGVIMITTKRAEKGQMQVDFDTYVSINDNPSYPHHLKGDAWFNYLEEGYRASNNGESAADRDALLSGWGFTPAVLNPYIDSSKWVDWMDETFQRGIQYNANLSVRAGNERIQSSFSVGYNKTNGIYRDDNLKKITLRENLNISAAEWIDIGIVTGLTYQDRDARSSRINKAFGIVPLGDVYDENGDINPFPIQGMDVVSIIADDIPNTYTNNRKSFNVTANPYIEIRPLKGLSFKSILGTSLSSSRTGVFNSDHTYMMLAGSTPQIRNASYESKFNYSYIWENILNYHITLADDHNLGATFVTSYENAQWDRSNSYSEDFLYDDYLFYNLDAGLNQRAETQYEVNKRMSYTGRVNYNYQGKYFITGSIRYDGVSQLAETWDIFPSAAAAWRISDESFMGWADSWLTNLKLRAGYGVSGNNNVNPYSKTTEVTNGADELNLGGGQLITVVPTQSITNVELGWEKTHSLNLGIDFGVIDGRINGSFEWYNQDSKDVIYDRDLPFSLGGYGPKLAYTLAANIANINNRGIELTLNTYNIQTQDFLWTSTLTFSRNLNEVTSIDLGSGQSADDLITEGLFINEPRYVYYNYKKTGIWQTADSADAAVFGLLPGDVRIESSLIKESDGVWYQNTTNEEGNDTTVYYTAENQYAINADDDRKIIGQQKPAWIAGFQNTFTYKGVDLGIFITARWGYMIDAELLGYFDHAKENLPENYDYWTETNPTNDYPRPYMAERSNAIYSDPIGGEALRFVDASYIKINNITLGYTLPASVLGKLKISNLRVYATMYNSFIFTKSHLLKGTDPETSASDSFPLYKQMVFGLNMSF